MIHVRRRDFVSGSHDVTGFQGIAERIPRGVTIYLLPGLTARQRRAVIRRLRQEASRGCGPELPLAQLVIALLVDRVRGAVGLGAGAVRWHPGVTLVPVAFVVAVMTLFVLASAGVQPVQATRPALAAGQSGGVRPSGVVATGGQGLGTGQPAPTGVSATGHPRAARVCFGAMPGVASPPSQLACHGASS